MTMPPISTDSSPINGETDDDDEPTNENKDSSRLQTICVLCEPSPITYMSGQASRFRLLMQHFSDQCYDKYRFQLVTADAVHPSPPLVCFDGKIPIHYTLGFCPPQYKAVTISLDFTLKTFRVLFPFKQQRVDLIHVSSPGMFLFPAILASQLYQIPLLMSYHTHIPIYARSYFPYPFNRILEVLAWFAVLVLHLFADLTLVTSPQIADEFREHYHRACLPSIPLKVWKKGVDAKRFHPKHFDQEMRRKMVGGNNNNNNPEDSFLLVYIGRLGKEKRLKDLRGVLEELERRRRTKASSVSNVRLCIVGSGPEENELRKYFAGTPTVFMGRLDGIELSKAFASGDVFCMPSDSETLGFVVLESMASGVPCVAAKVGGPVDLIDDGTTGYLVPAGDFVAFADRLEELQKNPDLRQKLSLEARRKTERWSWYASMDDIRVAAYPECIENFRSKRTSQQLYRWLVGLASNAPSTSKSKVS